MFVIIINDPLAAIFFSKHTLQMSLEIILDKMRLPDQSMCAEAKNLVFYMAEVTAFQLC